MNEEILKQANELKKNMFLLKEAVDNIRKYNSWAITDTHGNKLCELPQSVNDDIMGVLTSKYEDFKEKFESL